MAAGDVTTFLKSITSIGSEIRVLIDTGYRVSDKLKDTKQKLKQLGREQAFWEAQIVKFDLSWDRELLEIVLDAKSQLEHEKNGLTRKINTRRLPNLRTCFFPDEVEQTIIRVDSIFGNVRHELKRRTDITGGLQKRALCRVPLSTPTLPPRKTVWPSGPMLSTADRISSMAPDAAEGYRWTSSNSEGEEEEKRRGEDSTEPSSSSSSTPQNRPIKRLSNGAGISRTEVNQVSTEHVKETTESVKETYGELAVGQAGGKLILESANRDPAVMELTPVSNRLRIEQPEVSQISSIHLEGPKSPWTKGSRLGAGSFGTVYSAVDSGGMFFAVKEVSVIEQDKQALQALAQLKQEVEILKKFKHENIVQYLGTDQVADKLYIFLELVELGSLATVYKKFELANSQISKYTRDILKGLEYLHNRNIMHRDIKCANILVDKMGTCKLADFGMAKQISCLDLAKSFMGSAYWMAPEVINPQKTYGPPADIWSLGCSVLEMATGSPPFGEMEWYRAIYTVGRGNAPPIPDTLSDLLRDFIKLCFEIKPKKRPTATELLQHPFILQNSGVSKDSGRHLLPHSVKDLLPVTEERSSEFPSPQSLPEGAPLNVECR